MFAGTTEVSLGSAPELPIHAFERQILDALHDHQVVVIAADTGAGKSTEVPMMLHRAGYGANGIIGVTEPRRVAAMTLSEYVAEKNGGELGGVVGYQIGGQRELSRDTVVKYMTEGILLRELHGNPTLSRTKRHPGYSVIIADEVHKRGVNQDLILALMKDVLLRRPDLKLVIMSATIDEECFSEHFGGAPIVKVPGRMHPVDVRWADYDPFDSVQAAVDKTVEVLESQEPGDVLVFMPDEKTIKKVCEGVETRCSSAVRVFPLYGNQAPEDQREALRRRSQRRVIVATNIAETSLTIDGVVHVIDSGEIKQVRYVSETMSALEVCEHSKAGCEQRKGRAGRTQAGVCHRLYTRGSYDDRDAFTKPEILRTSLDGVLLHLRCLDYTMDEVLGLQLMDAPPRSRWERAQELLVLLGCMDADGEVTDSGRLIDQLAVSPMIGRMILTGVEYGCTDQIATIAAGLLARPVFVRPKGHEAAAKLAHQKFMDAKSDACTILKVYDAWEKACEKTDRPWDWARECYLSTRALREIERNREQIVSTLSRHDIVLTRSDKIEQVLKAVASGLLVNLCVMNGGRNQYVCGDQHDVYIYPGSSVFPPNHPGMSVQNPQMFVCAELWETSKVWARGCTVVDKGWLVDMIPESALSYSYELTKAGAVVCKTVFNGMELAVQTCDSFGEEAYPGIFMSIVESLSSGYMSLGATYGLIHESHRGLRDVYRGVKAGLLKSFDYLYVLPRDIQLQMDLLCTIHLSSQMVVAGCKTADQVLACDLSLNPACCLPEGFESALSEVRRCIEDVREESSRASAWEARREQQQAAERAQKANALRSYRERLQKLKDDLEALPICAIPSSDAMKRRAQSLIDSCDSGDMWWVETDAPRLESQYRAARSEYDSAVARTQRAWDAFFEAYPTCPVCGADWHVQGGLPSCTSHYLDVDPLVSIDGGHTRTLSEFKTNKGDVVISVDVSSLAPYAVTVWGTAVGVAWTGEAFKSVERCDYALIIPASLVDQRDDIVDMSRELKRIRAVLAESESALAELRKQPGRKEILPLKFSCIGGQAQCRTGGKLYRSAYVDPYPSEGEVWYCEVGGVLPRGC